MKCFATVIGFGLGILFVTPGIASMAMCQVSRCTGNEHLLESVELSLCATMENKCINGYMVPSCVGGCPGGGSVQQKPVSIPGCTEQLMVGICKVCPVNAEKECMARAKTFTDYAPGYQRAINPEFTADCQCIERKEFRCAAGYWRERLIFQSPDGSLSGCSPCPDNGDSVPGAIAKNQCFKYTFSDHTGSGHFSDGTSHIRCNYSD